MKKILTFLILAFFLSLAPYCMAGDRTLTFEWTHADPVAQGVTHFRIYKSTVSGTYDHGTGLMVEVEFTGESAIYETDATLPSPDGQEVIWYFVATAFDGQAESGHSNEVSQLVDFLPPGEPLTFTVKIKVTP